jgi:hypothetical protein
VIDELGQLEFLTLDVMLVLRERKLCRSDNAAVTAALEPLVGS